MARWSAVDVPLLDVSTGLPSGTLTDAAPYGPTPAEITPPTPTVADVPTVPACAVVLPLFTIMSPLVFVSGVVTAVFGSTGGSRVALTVASYQFLPTLTGNLRPLPRNDSKFWL